MGAGAHSAGAQRDMGNSNWSVDLTALSVLLYYGFEVMVMWIKTRLTIGNSKPFYSVGPMELMEKIESYSSLKKATEAMGMSYTKALRIIRDVENELGFPVVISVKGGNDRGFTMLTEKGKQVLTVYKEIFNDVSTYAERLVNEKFKF